MKKSMFRFFLVIMVMAALLVAFTVPATAADKFVIKLASEYPDKHPTIKNAVFPWIEEVKKKSDGRLVIQFFNPNTLCPAKEAYAAVTGGSVDMVITPCHFTHGKFPMSEAVQLPMIFNGAEAGSRTVWDLYQKYPEWNSEYEDLKVLWQWTSALFELHTKKKMVKTLDDLQGMKLIAWNPSIARIIKALGANPIEMTPHDTYLALERGMADGVMCPLAPMRAFKITDAAKYHTIVDIMSDTFYAAMNKDVWEKLPADLKKILEETTGEKMVIASGKTLDEGAIRDVKWMKEKGHEFYVLPAEEKAKWRAKVKPLHDDWLKKHPQAQDMYDEMIKLAGEYEKTTVGGYQE